MPQRNGNVTSSPYQIHVSSGASNAGLAATMRAAYDAAGAQRASTYPSSDICSSAIWLHDTCTLVYVNHAGVTVTDTALPAGAYPIEAASIVSTTADITCFM